MTSDSSEPLLSVRQLAISYGENHVVKDVDFALHKGEVVALIGQSGSGKSTIARAVLRLLHGGQAEVTGQVFLRGRELLSLSDKEFRPLRGREIGFVPQDPTSSLNPVRTIGSQAFEAVRIFEDLTTSKRKELIVATFEKVGLTESERVFRSYPHQLSGGMLQRVLIALAILPRPALVVADEPTSALDVTIQKRILDLLTELQQSLDLAILFITHDLAIAAERSDSLIVLRDGEIQECGETRSIFLAPKADYTKRLYSNIPGFTPRRFDDLRAERDREYGGAQSADVVAFSNVSKTFRTRGREVQALTDVSFAVRGGSTHALVGESGSGKSTAARLLLGLDQPDAGSIIHEGIDIVGKSRKELRAIRRNLQLVYQNPFTSLDPTLTVRQIISEPLNRYRVGTREIRESVVQEALNSVGLDTELLGRKPTFLSGGQRQRVAISRALVLRPRVLVLDEPTSALDVTVQSDILQVLFELQAKLGLSYLFVSHDLGVVRQFADTVTVLRSGRVVESGSVEKVFTAPEDEYTRALIGAIPGRDLAESNWAPQLVAGK